MIFHVAPPTVLQIILNGDMDVKLEGISLMVSDTVKTLGVYLTVASHSRTTSLMFPMWLWESFEVCLYWYRHILPVAAKSQAAAGSITSVFKNVLLFPCIQSIVLPESKSPESKSCRTLSCASLTAYVNVSTNRHSGWYRALGHM